MALTFTSLSLTNLSSSLPLSSSSSSSHSTFFTGSATLSNFTAHSRNSGRIRLRTPTTAPARKGGFTCNALFGLGVPELVVIAGVAALVFGPKKLPEVGKSIGKTVKSFQQGNQMHVCDFLKLVQAAKEFETELKKEPDSAIDSGGEKAATAVIEEDRQGEKVSSSKDSA